MKNTQKTDINKKRGYQKPEVERIQLDNEISLVMMSPPPDPNGFTLSEQFTLNPFKMLKS